MARKRKKSKRGLAPVRWWTSLDADYRRRALVGGALLSASLGCLLTAGYGFGRLDDHVRDMMLQQHPSAEVTFVDLPQDLAALALRDLHATVADLQSMRWTDDELCRATAERLHALTLSTRAAELKARADALGSRGKAAESVEALVDLARVVQESQPSEYEAILRRLKESIAR